MNDLIKLVDVIKSNLEEDVGDMWNKKSRKTRENDAYKPQTDEIKTLFPLVCPVIAE